MYDSGVFDSCERDATVNHAILLMGYGVDADLGKSYWLIRNSWGEDYGERGFIRVLRHDSDEGEAGYCGTDYKPLDGVGCKGGPPTLPSAACVGCFPTLPPLWESQLMSRLVGRSFDEPSRAPCGHP